MTTAFVGNFSDTWNDSGTTFNAIKVDVTDGASASDSTLIDLQVGSTSQFKVDKGGIITAKGFLAEGNVDLQGNRLVLDADNDSYINVNGDDSVSIYISGTEVLKLDGAADDKLILDGVSFSPTGAVLGQALGYPNSTTTLEPYTPAGGGDTLKAADETVTGDWNFTGALQWNGVQVVSLSAAQTLTNKTFDLTNNTLSGTTAQFNSALSDGSFATLAGAETLTNKTLTSPTIDLSTVTSAGDLAVADGGTGSSTSDAAKVGLRITVGTVAAMTALTKASLADGEWAYVKAYSSEGDGGEGWFRYDSGSSASEIRGIVEATDEGGAGRWIRSAQWVTPPMWGYGTGTLSADTAALQALVSGGYKIEIDREVVTDEINIDATGEMRFTKGGKFKFDGTNGTGDFVLDIRDAGDGYTFHSLTVDGDTANRKTSGNGTMNAIRGQSGADNIRFLGVTKVDNIYGRPLFAQSADKWKIEGWYSDACAGSFNAADCDDWDIGIFAATNFDTDDNGLQSDAFEMRRCERWTVEHVSINGMVVDDISGSVGGQAVVVEQIADCVFGSVFVRDIQNDATSPVQTRQGMSIVSADRCSWGIINIEGCDEGVEQSGCRNCTFGEVTLDGAYDADSLVNIQSTVGWHQKAAYETGIAVNQDVRHKSGNYGNVIGVMTIKRYGIGYRTHAGGNSIGVLRLEGCYLDGWRSQGTANQDAFENQTQIIDPIFENSVSQLIASGCGRLGVDLIRSVNLSIGSARIHDCGWDTAAADSIRAALGNAATSNAIVTDPYVGCLDTRSALNFDETDAVSFRAGSTTDLSSSGKGYQYDFSLVNTAEVTLFIGAIVSVDGVEWRVVDRKGDTFTGEAASSHTLTPTEVALTGTWTLAEDGNGLQTLTGSGGSANSEVQGRYWIKANWGAGDEWALVDGVSSDNTISIDPENNFTSSSGSGVTVYKGEDDIAGVKRQLYGVRIPNDANFTGFVIGKYVGDDSVNAEYHPDCFTGTWEDRFGEGSVIRIDSSPATLSTGGSESIIIGPSAVTGADVTTSIPASYKLEGYRAIVTTEVTGGGLGDLRLFVRQTSTSGDIDIFEESLGLTQNSKARGGITATSDEAMQIRSRLSSNPSAGAVRVEIFARKVTGANFANV